MKHLQTLNHYFVHYKWYFILGILFVACSNYFKVLQPQMIREALDLVFENLKIYQNLEGYEAQSFFYTYVARTLSFFGLAVLGLALIMGVFTYFTRQTIIVMSRLIEYDLRKELYDHYQELDLGFYRKNKTGDLMSRITEDVNKVRMYLGPAVLYGINLTFLVGFVIYTMFSVNVELSLYTLLPLPLLSISIYYVSSIINKRSTIIQEQLAHLNSLAQEVYSGIRVVKSYVQEKPMADYFLEESNTFKEKSLDLYRVNAFFFPLMVLLIGASTITTVFVGGIKVMNGTLSPGNIAEFVIYVNMLTWPVTSIGWIASIIQQAEASMKRINDFKRATPEIINTGKEILSIPEKIEFNHVNFVYPDTGIQALKDITFEITKGQKIGIVGRTASGKTTIADLLVRMFDPTSGEILINGKRIQHYQLKSLRNVIGYVPQDVFLFSDTVKNNIAFGTNEQNIETIQKYAKSASIHNEIMELSEGYESEVGERGVSLSGGQKQRISLARAFIKEPQLVILDDSLSAVDTNTEQKIINYLTEDLANRTAIVISHRLNILADFDKIIVLEDGKIVEQGTHNDLIAAEGTYAEMFKRQQLQEAGIED